MPDLSAHQNQRLRELIRAQIGAGKRFATLADFARALDVRQPSLWAFLSDEKRGLSHNTVQKLARLLGVTPKDLLGTEGWETSATDQYPSRARAIMWARQEGLPEAAIEEVMQRAYPTDPGGEQWMSELIEAAKRHRLMAALSGKKTDPPQRAESLPEDRPPAGRSGTHPKSARRSRKTG